VPNRPDSMQDNGFNDEQVILGVDTHNDVHVAAIITTLGVLLGTKSFRTTATGYGQLLDWARSHGLLRRAGVEGTSSHGTALTRHMRGNGVHVIEVNRPDRAARRRRGKTDNIDAENAARAVLSGQATAEAKAADGHAEAIRLFKIAKDSANKARTQAINQLRAVLVRADPRLRESLAGLGPITLFRTCAALPDTATDTTGTATIVVLQGLARRILTLTDEVKELNKQLTTALKASAPTLLERHGVGPDTAAALLITAGDNPQRLTSAAAFAALCGVNPIEASSGKTTRHRLNRGGDRRANSALYTIVLTRLGRDQRTREYANRRTTQGKSTKEIIRCLKRYVARELFPLITAALTPAPTPPAGT
jgi:transposase